LTLYGVHSLDKQQQAARARARAAAAAAPAPAAAVLAGRDRGATSDDIPSGWGRDPFARAVQDRGDDDAIGRTAGGREPSGGTGLYLQGIMVGPTGRTALINGDVCREGERVGAYEVLSIGTRTVMLMQNGNVTTLTLRGGGS
jgi:uncharacterized protein (UPF0261 family)